MPAPEHKFRCANNVYYDQLRDMLDFAINHDDNELARTIREAIDNPDV
jgi:regulator of PEP synthase PpsR (kinase-PPPase family)